MKPKIDYTLYLVTDRNLMSAQTIESAVEQSLKGGCTLIQLREKDISSGEFYNLALRVKKITDEYNVPLIINDRADIAAAVDAAGVHVGQGDLPCAAARKIVGKNKIVGVSVTNVAEALAAQAEGADYIGVGAMFPTGTKTDAKAVTREELQQIVKEVSIPVVAIGGINEKTLPFFDGIHIDGIAVVSAIISQKNIAAAAKNIKRLFIEGRRLVTCDANNNTNDNMAKETGKATSGKASGVNKDASNQASREDNKFVVNAEDKDRNKTVNGGAGENAIDGISAAIFDLDGTLLESMDVWENIDIAFLEKRGHKIPPFYLNKICALSFREAAEYTIKLFNMSDTVDDLIAEWDGMALDEYARNIRLKEGAEQYLKTLKNSGIRLAVATGLPKRLFEPVLKNNGIYDLFEIFCSVDDVKRGKEHPDIYEHAIKRLKLKPSQCAIFEDLLATVRTAKRTGAYVCGVFDKYSDMQSSDIEKEADCYIRDFCTAPVFKKSF